MKAIAYQESLPVTNSKVLMDIEQIKPVAKDRDILVKIEAVSVNPVDTKVRMRAQPPEGKYKVLGWDATGIVESVGDDVSLFSVGDKVWYAGALDRQGCNSEFHLVDERIVSEMPTLIGFAEAAAMPLTTITAWEVLFDRLKLATESQGSILIIGAAGGVGSIMIQLAKQLTNLTVIATASRPETQEWASSLGADHVINHHEDMVVAIENLGIGNVEHVASLTHTDTHLEAISQIIAPQGQLALIDDPESFDIMPFKQKCVSIHWEFMFTRSLFQTHDMIKQHELLAKVAKMIDTGTIRSTAAGDSFDKINAKNLIKAHAFLESGKSKGKVVLAGF